MVKRLSIIILLLSLIGCSPEDFGEAGTNIPQPPSTFKGLYVINEGLFGHGNGEITFINEATGDIIQNLFYHQNGYIPGDIVFDVAVFPELILLTVNNSNTLYLLNSQWQVIKKLKLTQPRWLLPVGNKVFISSLYRPYVYVFDLQTKSIVDSIPSHRPLEQLLWVNDKLWGIHWSSLASTLPNRYVMIIDTFLRQPVDSIAVGKEPNSMVVDKNGKIWILCSGGYDQVEDPSLWQINPITHQVIKVFSFARGQDYPTSLTTNETSDTLFYINKHVFAMPIHDNSLPSSPIFTSSTDVFYALSYDPQHQSVWICNAKDYLHNGEIIEINSLGHLKKTFPTGIIPRKVFRIN